MGVCVLECLCVCVDMHVVCVLVALFISTLADCLTIQCTYPQQLFFSMIGI